MKRYDVLHDFLVPVYISRNAIRSPLKTCLMSYYNILPTDSIKKRSAGSKHFADPLQFISSLGKLVFVTPALGKLRADGLRFPAAGLPDILCDYPALVPAYNICVLTQTAFFQDQGAAGTGIAFFFKSGHLPLQPGTFVLQVKIYCCHRITPCHTIICYLNFEGKAKSVEIAAYWANFKSRLLLKLARICSGFYETVC
ncbi:MAG: hypothetical protein WAZ99_09720, partial [Rectinemataceae bacterium]